MADRGGCRDVRGGTQARLVREEAATQTLRDGRTHAAGDRLFAGGSDRAADRWREDYAIALAKAAGFELVAASEVLANPRDTKDYPSGVWTLPPTLRLGEVDRAKYMAIGESDKFLLKFRKPAR